MQEQRIVALLDSPNPDVLELRRLTPTQAAAAAEAAARQEARVEKLKAVPDAERKPKGDDDWTDGGGGAIAQLMEKTPLIHARVRNKGAQISPGKSCTHFFQQFGWGQVSSKISRNLGPF